MCISKIADKLTDFDTILFHGSVIAVDGIGYLFTAKSGTGKSTHTRLWREYFGERAVMVNDDKLLIRIAEKGAEVYDTPLKWFTQEEKISVCQNVALRILMVDLSFSMKEDIMVQKLQNGLKSSVIWR